MLLLARSSGRSRAVPIMKRKWSVPSARLELSVENQATA